MSVLARHPNVPNVPNVLVGQVAGLAVAVQPGDDRAALILSGPSAQLTADQCLGAIRMLAEAAQELIKTAPPEGA